MPTLLRERKKKSQQNSLSNHGFLVGGKKTPECKLRADELAVLTLALL